MATRRASQQRIGREKSATRRGRHHRPVIYRLALILGLAK
jgi:hypothetical protein